MAGSWVVQQTKGHNGQRRKQVLVALLCAEKRPLLLLAMLRMLCAS